MIQPETGFPDLMVWPPIHGFNVREIVLQASQRIAAPLAYERTVPLLHALYGSNPTEPAWVAQTWASMCLIAALGDCFDAGFPRSVASRPA